MQYDTTSDLNYIGRMIKEELEEWGEVILHLASGEVAEIHKGDDGVVTSEYIRFMDNHGDRHTILFSQIERITTHRASVEE